MKGKILIAFMLVAFVFVSWNTANAQTKTKYYILFDNFDDQKDWDSDSIITNLIDLYYWEPMTKDFLFSPYVERAPFSAATFNKRAITEYDVAVFPMGVTNGLDVTVGGVKVIDKIFEMINAGKTVIIIGNAVVYKGFNGGDPKVKEFLSNYLGIQYPLTNQYVLQGRLSFTDGSTYWGGSIDGIEGDPIAKGYDKVINVKYKVAGGGWTEPVRYYPNIDVMGLKPDSKSIGFEFVKKVGVGLTDSVDVSDLKMWTGIRHEEGTARVVLWTTNFDIVNPYYRNDYHIAYMAAFQWGTRDIPKPEKYVLTENLKVDFGRVEPGSKKYKTFAFQNWGRTPLSVTGMEIFGLSEEVVYRIVEGGDPVKLDPMEIHTMNLEFAPINTVVYEDGLDVFSDATNGDLNIDLYGIGGENTEFGPKIVVSEEPIDFGTVQYGQYIEKNISVGNVGDSDLDIYEIDMVNDANKLFSFPQTIKLPIVIKPGGTWYFKVRFTPADTSGGTYNGEVTLRSSSLGDNTTSVYFKAVGAAKNSSTGVSVSTTEIDFGKVKIGESSIYDIVISNVGTNELIFPVKPSFIGGGEIKAQYSFVDGTENIPNLQAGGKHTLKIKFAPKGAKVYGPLTVKITSNAENNGIINLSITGEGEDPTSVEDNPLSGVLSLQVNPSINNGNAVFAYDYTGGLDKNIDVKIVDINGKTRMNLYNGKAINGMHFINLSNLSLESGKYFIVAEMDGYNKMIQFVIQK